MLFRSSKIINWIIILGLFFSCKKKEEQSVETEQGLTPYNLVYPYYFPQPVLNQDNPLTYEGIALGHQLYYDTILSNDGRSCSSCHKADEAFSSSLVNSLPHINLGWNTYFLWRGKVSGKLEDIMMFEVNEFFNTNINKVNNSSYYREKFKQVYGTDVITANHIASALAQFFRVMVSSDSKCDKFFTYKANFTDSELRGFMIFTTEKGDCFHCHSLGLFTDNGFHNIGIDSIFTGSNRGRFEITGNPADMGHFKTPTLRNIELTAPYMHDGRFQTLDEVIEHYNSGVKKSSTLDPIMTKPGKEFGLGLTAQQKLDLIAFLKTLTDTNFTKNKMLLNPN